MIDSAKNWALSVRLVFCNALVARVPSHSLRLWFYRRGMKASIGRGSSIHLDAYLDAVGNRSIGEDSTVNRQCRLDSRGGRGAVVAAGAVVTRDVAAGRVVAGVPARDIGRRTTELAYSAAYRRPLF